MSTYINSANPASWSLMRSFPSLVVSCLLSAIPLAGCGGGGSAATTPPPPVAPTYSAGAQYAYVSTLQGYIDTFSISSTGKWTKIANPGAAQNGQISLAMDPKHRFLYAASGGSADSVISSFVIDTATGSLAQTSPFGIHIAGLFNQGLAVDGLGKFLYTADSDSNTVTALAINQITGVPTVVSSVAAGQLPDGVTTDAAGKYVYIANRFGGNISEYVIDPATGNLTPNNPATVNSAGLPYAGTINAAGTFFYSVGTGTPSIETFSMNAQTGVLSAVPNGTLTNSDGPSAIALTPNGKFAYAVNFTSSDLTAYSVNATTGLLTQISSVIAPGADQPYTIAMDPDGQLLYVVCLSGNAVTIFGINADGSLTQQQVITTDEQPGAIALFPR